MRNLDVKKMIPDIYCQESRDFQILCNLYGCIVNGLKYDSFSLYKTIDTNFCRDEFLKLLATKLGFFTDKQISTQDLRYALLAFKDLLNNKGTLKSIAGAVHTFLKALGIHNKLRMSVTTDKIVIGGRTIKDHTVILEIESAVQDTTLLEEIFKYLIPAGYEYIITFYTEIDPYDDLKFHENVTLIYTSDTINSNVRGAYTDGKIEIGGLEITTTKSGAKVLGAVDTIEINGDDITVTYTNPPQRTTQYRGVTTNLSLILSPENNDIVGLLSGNLYYVYIDNTFQLKTFAGTYAGLASVPVPVDDTVIYSSGSGAYHLRINDKWYELNFRGKVKDITTMELTDFENHDIVIANKVTLYKYNGTSSTWEVYDYPIQVITQEEYTH